MGKKYQASKDLAEKVVGLISQKIQVRTKRRVLDGIINRLVGVLNAIDGDAIHEDAIDKLNPQQSFNLLAPLAAPPVTGACCYNGVCHDGWTQANCDGVQGTYMGDGTTCTGSVIACAAS